MCREDNVFTTSLLPVDVDVRGGVAGASAGIHGVVFLGTAGKRTGALGAPAACTTSTTVPVTDHRLADVMSTSTTEPNNPSAGVINTWVGEYM